MIQRINNKENKLSMAFKYIDKHSLSLAENTQTTVNAGGVQDGTGERPHRQCSDQRMPWAGVSAEC